MVHFFSRRAFDSSRQTFTNNPAAITRYAVNEVAGGVQSGQILDRDDWIADVAAAAGAGDIVIYVHGFNTDHIQMSARHRLIEQHLAANGFAGTVVSFDWPSDGSPFAYGRDRTDAKAVAEHFVTEGVFLLAEATSGSRIHIIAHSMGAYLVLRGFSGLGGSWKVGQVLFVAADVDRDWMEKGAWGALVMARRCARLTNYSSIHDEVLNLSRGFINGGRDRAGLSGLPGNVPSNHVDLYCARQFETKVADKLGFNSHRWYFEDAGFCQDAALTIGGADAGEMRTRHPTDVGGLALLT